MNGTHLDDLIAQMEAAVAVQDFEAAGRLRDQIDGIRLEARIRDVEEPVQASYFQRQVPGRMGLGTDQPTPKRPAGWVPPKPPDPMTTGRSRAGRRGKA